MSHLCHPPWWGMCHLPLCPWGVAATVFTLGTAPRMQMEKHLLCKAMSPSSTPQNSLNIKIRNPKSESQNQKPKIRNLHMGGMGWLLLNHSWVKRKFLNLTLEGGLYPSSALGVFWGGAGPAAELHFLLGSSWVSCPCWLGRFPPDVFF